MEVRGHYHVCETSVKLRVFETPDPLDAKGILRLRLPLVICKRPAQRLLFTTIGSGLGKII